MAVDVRDESLVISRIAEGATVREVAAELHAEGLSPQDAARVVGQALARIEELGEEAYDVRRRGWCLAACTAVYRKALAAGEYGPAIRAIERIQKLSSEKKAAGTGRDLPAARPGQPRLEVLSGRPGPSGRRARR